MRVATVNTLMELIEENNDIFLITADLGFNLLDNFGRSYPKRFLNVGVCEANMIGVAAGLAMRGKRVFCYSIAPFSIFRPLDQIRVDLCAPSLPVTILSAGGGVCYGMEGMTHNAIEDLAITRALPNLTVMVPADPIEASMLIRATLSINGPCYFRLGAKNEPVIYDGKIKPSFGQLTCLKNDGDIAIIANGIMVYQAVEAASELSKKGINCRVYSLHTVKPLDYTTINKIALQCRIIVSVEEHSVINGCGSAIAEVLFEQKYTGVFIKIGLPDMFDKVMGHGHWMRQHYGLDSSGIVKTVRNALLQC